MIGHEFLDKVTGFDTQQAGVDELPVANFLVHFAEADKLAFDAEEVVLPSLLGNPKQKAALATTDIDFDRLPVAEDL